MLPLTPLLCTVILRVMTTKKVKNQLKDKIVESINEIVASFNANLGEKRKKSTLASAKKISSKFAKTLKELEREEKKAAKKNARKAKKTTKAKLKAEKRIITPVAKKAKAVPVTAPKAPAAKAPRAKRTITKPLEKPSVNGHEKVSEEKPL